MLYADDRRLGDHGIGRFARNVLAQIDHTPISLRTDPNSPLDPIRLSRELHKLKPGDRFFSPGYNPPLSCPVPFHFTIHDLNHLDMAESSSPLKRLYYASFVKRACFRAISVFTVSEFSRRRILEWSRVSPQRVVNVGNGVGTEFNPHVKPYPLPFPYLLCVSNRKRHKNERRQIEAFAQSGLPKEIRLVFTGEPTAEMSACVAANRVEDNVLFLGRIPEGQLPSLYRGAEALTFVSLYEGFGLPVVEAMACGTAVLTSNTTGLSEIAGDAALLVNPTSTEEISAGMRQVLLDTGLRGTLRERGLLRANQFTWRKTAALVREALERTAKADGERAS